MKLSVFNPVLGDMPFESAMQYLAQCGVDAVEIGCGGYPGKAHCDPALLLEDEGTLSAFKRVLKKTVWSWRRSARTATLFIPTRTWPNPFGRTFKTRCCWPNGWA